MFRVLIRLCIISLATVMVVSCAGLGVKKRSDGTSTYSASKKKLKGKSSIKGYVRNAQTNKGIKDAHVEIKNANMGIGYYQRKTNSRGYFEVDDFITQVNYVVEVTAPGYVSYRSSGYISEGKHEVKLQPEAVLTGKVKNSAGKPMKGVQVKLKKYSGYYSYNSEKPVIIETDDSGVYRFDKLVKGSYLVTFNKAGFISETARMKNIKQGETFRLPMVMIKPASMSGKITIKGLNTPAINVNISAGVRVAYTGSTFHDGTYRLEEMKPGRYELRISHQGFYPIKTEYIQIREGEQKKNINFIIKPKEPQVKVSAYRYTFAPGNNIEFNMRSIRLESVKVTIYKVPMGVLLMGGIDPDKISPTDKGFTYLTRWEEPVHDFRPYEWRYQTLQVKTPLSTGGYCIEVKGAGKIISRKFFTLTSVGVVMKRSQGSIFTYVTNLVTNKPIPDARVAIFDTTPKKKKPRYSYRVPKDIMDLPVKVLLKGKTNDRGIFHKKFRSWKYLTALVVGTDGSYAICNTGSPSAFQRERVKYFIYTDRPVYRAGDTVFYKVIGKKREKRFTPTAGQRIYYKIANRYFNKTVDEGYITLDDWGTGHGKIKLPTSLNLGEFEIRTGPTKKNLYGSGRFYVEQYRKPEFKIEITPAKDYFINGDMTEFKVEAKYFFGAPLKGALVKYRFYETRLRDTDTRYWWEDDYSQRQSYNRIKLEGEKYADKNGIAVLRLHAGNYPYDRELTVEATVVDKSNISISSRKKVRVGRGEFYIKINPRQHFFSGDEKKFIDIKTLTHTGKAVKADVKIQLFRYRWKPWQRVYVHDKKPVFSKKITTNRKGQAILELPKKFEFYGEFDIIATGSDRKDNLITASRVIWIYSSSGGKITSRFKNLELSLNATKIKKPGEVTCLVKSRYTDAYVCLTLEGRDIYETKVIKMTGNIVPVKFFIKPEYAPNLYLTATMQRKRALFTGIQGISLPVTGTELKIAITSDKKEYLPGEKASVMFTVTDPKGKPVQSDLSLSAVDEAIYYVRRDHTPKMQNFFYTKISNWVLTSYSYPITVLAGVGKDGKVKVREKFEDTAFWKANIRTNEKGMARVNFTLPDNLTTWRLTARGHDKTGRVGENKGKFLVTQELIARVGKPRFTVEGDRINLIGIVNSNTKRGLTEVKTEFMVDGSTVEPDKKIKISLPAFGSARNYYSYTIPRDKKKVQVQFTARADKKAADALRINIPVQRRGAHYKLYGIGDMAMNKTITINPVKSTGDFRFKPEKVTISVSPSPIIQMIRATKFLSKYPYGCIEQTLNRFIPALTLQRLLKQKGYDQFIDKKALKDLSGKVKAGISRIQRHQNYDGTWGWWYGGRGNAFVTGYVLKSLYIARLSGYAVEENRVIKGLKALRNYFKNPKLASPDSIAYMLYIYSLWGGWDHDAYTYLIKKGDPSPYRLAYMVRAAALAEKVSSKMITAKQRKEVKDKFPGLMAKMKGMVKKDARGLYWESYGAQRWSWQGGHTEVTAHALAALVDAGDRSTYPAQIVRSLSKRSRGDAWRSTKETSSVILAMCRYLEKMGGRAVTKGNVNFSFNNKKVANISYDMNRLTDVSSLEKTVTLNGDTAEKSSYTISADGTAGKDLSFDVTVAGILYFKEKGFMSLFKSMDRSLNTLSNGIKITRGFAGITRVRDQNHNEYMVPQSLRDKKIIRVGDELLVKVKFQAQDNFKYMVLEDYLPSGFEVVRKSAYDFKPYIHVERWDNRMVFFFTDVKKGEVYEVAYIVRAELPGNFMVRPTRMECMYEPTIQGWSVPTIVEVEKK